MRFIAAVIVAVSALAFLYCAYAFAFFAWVTATPLDAPQLARAQFLANTWLGLAALSLVTAIAAFVFALRQQRK